MENSGSETLIEYRVDEAKPSLKTKILVNHLRAGTISMIFISHMIEVGFVLFLSIFVLGPAVFFIISGLFSAFLFVRPHWFSLLGVYKAIFHVYDEDFYLNEINLNFWFWISRILMVIFAIGQIIIGIYFLNHYGFLDQNLIYLLMHN
jgi:hypothetical protein